MSDYFFNANAVEDRLTQLPIGTEDVRDIMDYIRRDEFRIASLSQQLDHAAKMIGYQAIRETLIEVDYDE